MKYDNYNRPEFQEKALYQRKIGIESRSSNSPSLKYTLILIIISAIIFVTIVSLYDVLRNFISKTYATATLNDPISHNLPEQIEATLLANNNAFYASLTFAGTCLLLAIVLIP